MEKVSLFADMVSASGSTLEEIIRLAVRVKANPEAYRGALRNKLLYALYQKTSTRTHLSFARALTDLGGEYVWQSWDSSNFAIGDFEQEVKYVSTTADVLMARLISNQDVKRMAGASSIPVINGCCNRYHPMQALADCLTMYELTGSFREVRCVYVGVFNNVVNSLVASLPRLGGKLVAVCPEINEAAIDRDVVRDAEASGNFTLIADPTPARLHEEIASANFVYTDTWVDMEEFADKAKARAVAERCDRLGKFQLNPAVYDKSRAFILHCMPVHTGYEIDAAMLSLPTARILQQAENRAHAQKAALCYLFQGG